MLTQISPIKWASIEHQAGLVLQAFKSHKLELAHLEEEVLFQQNAHCNGGEHWRDANSSKHSPKLYIIHKTSIACPIHGTPEPGKRIRTYIGSDSVKIREAQALMERGKEYKTNMAELNRKYRNVQTAAFTLQRIYWALGMPLPEPPNPEPE